MEKLTLGVIGMTCGGCVRSVEVALARVAGVSTVVVSLAEKQVVVEGTKLDRARLVAAIEDAGYDVAP